MNVGREEREEWEDCLLAFFVYFYFALFKFK